MTFKYFLNSFRVIVGMNYSADTMRSLSLFITYAIHKPRHDAMDLHRRSSAKYTSNTPTRRKTVSGATPKIPQQKHDSDLAELDDLQVALGVLELYSDMLCQEDDDSNMKKFARTVTNKVRFAFFLAPDEYMLIGSVAPFPAC